MAESPVDTLEEDDAIEGASVWTVKDLIAEIASIVESADGLYFDYVVGVLRGICAAFRVVDGRG